MNDLDRIEHTLKTKKLDASLFERCAQDMLSEVFPGLTPIPGGTDWGRDADIAGNVGLAAPRLLVTSSRTLEGVRKNMLGGIRSLAKHDVAFERLVLANAATLSQLDRQSLSKSAKKAGGSLDVADIFDLGFFASRLRRDGHWRKQLLGLPSLPIALSRTEPTLAESPWAFLPLVARSEDLSLLQGVDDVLLSGPPGVGKSRLAAELHDAVFIDRDMSFDQIANDVRWALPANVIVDDAGDQRRLVRQLLNLRRSDPDLFRYRLIAICWPDDVPELQTELSSARVQTLELLERAPLGGC